MSMGKVPEIVSDMEAFAFSSNDRDIDQLYSRFKVQKWSATFRNWKNWTCPLGLVSVGPTVEMKPVWALQQTETPLTVEGGQCFWW